MTNAADWLGETHAAAARKKKCEVCQAKPGKPCVSPIDGKELIGGIHWGRMEIS